MNSEKRIGKLHNGGGRGRGENIVFFIVVESNFYNICQVPISSHQAIIYKKEQRAHISFYICPKYDM